MTDQDRGADHTGVFVKRRKIHGEFGRGAMALLLPECEFAYGYCFPAGNRPVTVNGKKTVESWPVAGCNAEAFQNGDLDFDGNAYQPGAWPNATANQPTAIRYMGPFDASGALDPTVQFETDVAGSEFVCDTTTGHDCSAPPLGSAFYPFYSLNNTQTLTGDQPSWGLYLGLREHASRCHHSQFREGPGIRFARRRPLRRNGRQRAADEA